MRIPPFAVDDYFANHPIPPSIDSVRGTLLATLNETMTPEQRHAMAHIYRVARRAGGANGGWRVRSMRHQLRAMAEFMRQNAT